MADQFSPAERSAIMAKVKSTGNRTTEGRVEAALVASGVVGWVKHPREVLGKPDFFFPEQRLALFVDGCFWHGCPVCKPLMPVSHAEYWRAKIDRNRRRDNRHHRRLRRDGYHVMRVWEHELKADRWLKRLRAMLRRNEGGEAAADAG